VEKAAGNDARVRKTRAALAAAMLALAEERPFADLTVGEIAQRADVGYATFFRHYRDKEALLLEVADALMNDLLGLMAPALIEEDTLRAARALCRFVDECRAICTALLAGGAEADIRRQLVRRARSLAERADLRQPDFAPRDLLINHAVASTLGLLAWWLDHPGVLDAEAAARLIDGLVLSPVRAG